MPTIRGGRYTILGTYSLAGNMVVFSILIYHHLGCVGRVALESFTLLCEYC